MNGDPTGSIRRVSDPVVKIFENGSAVLLRPEVPDWIRTSEVGAWIFALLGERSLTTEQIVSKAVARYGLPAEAVRPSILQFLDVLISQGYAEVERESEASAGSDQESESPLAAVGSPSRPRRLEELKLFQLWIHVTSTCNLRCAHCYYPVERPGRELPLDVARQLFDQAARLGVRQIVLSGGEPMLHSQILDLVRLCRHTAPFHIKVISNGTMPGENVFDHLVEMIDDLQISIDGIDAATHDAIRGKGAFARVVRVFKRLYDTRARVTRGLAFTPTPDNVDQIPELNKLGYHLGADYIHLNHPKPPAHPAQHERLERAGFLKPDFLRQAIINFRRLYVNILSDRKDARGMRYRPLYLDASFNYATNLTRNLHRDNCGAGITMLSFDPQGKSYPCAALTDREGCQLGEFPEQSLEQLRAAGRVWNRSVFSVDGDPICQQCIYRYFCGGGCRATANGLSERDPFCPVMLDCYEEFLQYVSRPDDEKLARAIDKGLGRRDNHAIAEGCSETLGILSGCRSRGISGSFNRSLEERYFSLDLWLACGY
ncbi:MAG: radical SAM protein [Acidobacteria bacterium]|nr:MAG: radical SAM protein [Acidobacteriota bacterium]